MSHAFMIGVAGGSGAGKSLFAQALAARLAPRSVVLISEDDYYRRFEDPDPSRDDFDVPAARDHVLLAEQLGRLRQGQTIDRPDYDFRVHAPRKRAVRTGPAEVVIVEGLHVLHAPQVRALLDFSVFLDVADDIRFIRRLLRDTRRRGRSMRSVVAQYRTTVRPAHEQYVKPTRALADLVLSADGAPDLSEEALLESWLDETLGALADQL